MNRYKYDLAWEQIFEKHRILDAIKSKGRVTISSTDINEFREARLMTKFDHRSQLPHLFSENNLSILPTSRGTYEISTFETFCTFKKEEIDEWIYANKVKTRQDIENEANEYIARKRNPFR